MKCAIILFIFYTPAVARLKLYVIKCFRLVVNLLHAPKLVLRGLKSTNPAKIVRKCQGTKRVSQISRIPRAILHIVCRELLYDRMYDGVRLEGRS